MPLKWVDKIDGADDIFAEDINAIARAVIENEKNIEESKSVAQSAVNIANKAKEYGKENAGELIYVGADGISTALAVGEGLQIKDEIIAPDYSNIANALKGNASGEVISLDDVSPLEHTLEVKARSKNIIPLPYYNESGYENNGITYTYGADGIIYASGTSTAASRFYITPYASYLPISVGTYIISIAGTGIDGKNIQLIGNIYSQSKDEYLEIYYDRSRSLIRNIGNGGKFRFYLYIPSGVTLENAEIRVQFEKGTTPTEYAPYVDVIGTMILVNETEYPVNADGKAQGVKSIAPNMTITSDTGGVMLDVAYNKDTNKVIEKLINRIAALESAVI